MSPVCNLKHGEMSVVYAGRWDAAALGEALHVPPPAAHALATSLNAAAELPQHCTIEEVTKRCLILQRDLGLDSIQVWDLRCWRVYGSFSRPRHCRPERLLGPGACIAGADC
jgi:hypothetical protein